MDLDVHGEKGGQGVGNLMPHIVELMIPVRSKCECLLTINIGVPYDTETFVN